MATKLTKFHSFFKRFQRGTAKAKPSIYIASGIEFATSLDWRDWIKQNLNDKYNVILPDLIPCPYQKGSYEFAGWYYENFIKQDITDVVNCDQFFIFIDQSFCAGAGGKAELTLAAVLEKPITYCVHNVSPENMNKWVIGCLHNATRVDDFNKLIEHYKKL